MTHETKFEGMSSAFSVYLTVDRPELQHDAGAIEGHRLVNDRFSIIYT